MDPKPMLSKEFRNMIIAKIEDESRMTDIPIVQILEELTTAIKKREKFKEGLALQERRLMEEYGYSRKEALLLIRDILEENNIIRKSQE